MGKGAFDRDGIYYFTDDFVTFVNKSLKLEKHMRITWLVVILSPIIVTILVTTRIFNVPTDNDWIGFYASLFGGLLSGLLTYFSMYMSMAGIRKQISQQDIANEILE